MTAPEDPLAVLEDIGRLPDAEIDLARAALTLASLDRPGPGPEPYLRHFEKLAQEVGAHSRRRAGRERLTDRIDALRAVLGQRYGYRGDEEVYEDPDAANLIRVIDQRRGLPVALGIIYLTTARRLGWTADGIGFPVRFLVRMELENTRVLLDPFDGGREVEPPELRSMYKAAAGNHVELTPEDFECLSNRKILLRLQNRVKARLLRAGKLPEALETIQVMLRFAPEAAALWRETGLLHARLENLEAAVSALEEYLRQDTVGAARDRTSLLLEEIRTRLV